MLYDLYGTEFYGCMTFVVVVVVVVVVGVK
jgi:hypothetical protein